MTLTLILIAVGAIIALLVVRANQKNGATQPSPAPPEELPIPVRDNVRDNYPRTYIPDAPSEGLVEETVTVEATSAVEVEAQTEAPAPKPRKPRAPRKPKPKA